MNDPRDYLVVDTLRNGTTVTIRAIRPEDKTRLASAFKNLDRESVLPVDLEAHFQVELIMA